MSEVPTNGFPDSWGGLGAIPFPTDETMIGRGAFGEVYRWNRDGTEMAVKRIRVTDGYTPDIERETNIVSRLVHKHIIQCYGVERDANYVYIVTDYAEGGDLSSASPRLDWEDRKRIVVEVALGLAYLHSQGIIHRDIKGANILLTKYNEAKLCDFGLAKVMASATCASTYTPKGTRKWMAPELISARPKYSSKSDVFALGVVMRELEHGDTPLDYTAIMTRCIDEDPDKRPTLEDVVDAFQVVPQVRDTATEEDQVKAEQDSSAEDEYKQGLRFYSGDGVDVNRAEAAEIFRRAANMGHARAQYVLGKMYQDGDSVLRDYTKAAECFQKAADQGYAPARTGLGLSYLDGGKGVPQDYSKALELFQAAASQGYIDAYPNLGWMYSYGLGVPKNNEEAVKWYRQAAEQGCAVSQANMGELYAKGVGVEQNVEEAARFRLMAAAQGHTESQHELGNMYALGLGVSRDRAAALDWWHKAAEGGNMEAQCFVGLMYVDGKDVVRKNQAKGRMWLKKAAEQGNEHAQYHVEVLRINLSK
ncbi:kinase-like domain-containing protein [Dissophora ornata]|nr:kinase-like domain-containing protein [Dissophora ornata]